MEQPKNPESNKPRNPIENAFEYLLWNSRLVVLLAVIFGILGAISLFVLGSREVFHVIQEVFSPTFSLEMTNSVLIGIVGAIDLYLIGIVLIIFSFGVYELFISRIDIARLHEDITILDIGSLDELKNKILKVVVMVLIVSFFKAILTMEYKTPLEMLYYAISIVGVSAAVYLIRIKESE